MYTATPEAARHAVRLGADAVIGKTTLPSRLLETVLDLLDQRTHSGGTKEVAARRRWPAGHLGWAFAGPAQFERAITSFLAEGPRSASDSCSSPTSPGRACGRTLSSTKATSWS